MPVNYVERIPLRVFQGVNATLFASALITATTRTVIRFHSQRQLHPDDYILMFACATLIASQVLLYVLKIEFIYSDAGKILDSVSGNNLFSSFVADGSNAELLRRRVSNPQPILFSSLALSWTCIYTVKICFLLFFHQLITRLRRWILAWKVIFGITIIFWAYCASAVFIGCPKFTQLACTAFEKNLALAIVRIVLDITSDLLIISIPVILLWKVKIKRQQKVFLGIFLCLSVCMIIIAIVRISGLRMETTGLRMERTVLDIVWELFWQQAEAAVAVIMVSITAFRSLLGIKANAHEKTQRCWEFSQHRPNLQAGYFNKTQTTATHDESELERLPEIPGANLSGMRTFIYGESMLNESSRGGGTGVEVHMFEKRDLLEAHNHEPHEIKVTHQFSVESEILNRPRPAGTAKFM